MEDNALENIGKSAVIIFAGTVVGSGLNYLTRILIARFFGPSEYGLISMGIAILSFVTTISLLGLREGMTRWISYFIEDEGKIKDIITSTFKITLPFSLVLSIILFLFSENIALFLGEPGLTSVIKIFCLAVPFYVILDVFVAGMRGLQNSIYKVYSYDLALPGSKLILVFIAVLLGYSIETVVSFYAIAIIFSAAVSFILFRRIFQLDDINKGSFSLKRLIFFSWPLMITTILFMVATWMDIFMIGFFKTSYQVGIYNAALPIASALIFPLFSFKYMFMPKTSEFFSKDIRDEMKEVYRDVVRWIFLSTLPFMMTIVIFSDEILLVFFGSQYTAGSFALLMLSLGYFYGAFVGPTGDLLISLGKTKKFMLVFILITLIDFVLNIFLIRIMGINGAAIAMTVSFFIGWTVSIKFVYDEIGEHPFQTRLIKPFLWTSVMSLPFIFTSSMMDIPLIFSVVLGAIYIPLYLGVIYISGSLEEREIEIFRNIKDKILDL